ncbi:hypothetical protein [Qipengyuania aquimaris]|uniref:hypothetical protein n=1 Tax=Qipengyuania aquimaris TaxID=255984 RepID=UPI0018F8B910|nr:hypothetical protein [Qipengyuania aquimaris]
MELPKIDISNLPGLDTVTGLFGSFSADGGPTVDDRVIVIMVYVYETVETQAFF